MKQINGISNYIISELKNDIGLTFRLMNNGSIFSIEYHDHLINLLLGNPLEGSVSNIYLRILDEEKIYYHSILGPDSGSVFQQIDDKIVWQGTYKSLKYQCILNVEKEKTIWYWDILLQNISEKNITADIIYTQDIGIGQKGYVRSNESYCSQYIDHYVTNHPEYGYIICNRQNLAQFKSKYPWIMQGSLNKTRSFSTDGFQFFGLSYKDTDVPEALINKSLSNKKTQYEFCFTALQSEKIELSSDSKSGTVFFALFEEDHPLATSESDLTKINEVKDYISAGTYINIDNPINTIDELSLFSDSGLFKSQTLTENDINRFFSKEIRHIEKQDGKLLSFFYGAGEHVILKEKENYVERPHGHIIRSGDSLQPNNENILASTQYIYGLFNAQICIGNTNFNRFLSKHRNHLNVIKSSGQRIFIKNGDSYELLSLPSAFEIGINHCRWIYKNDDKTIIVKVWISLEKPAVFLNIEEASGTQCEFLIYHSIYHEGSGVSAAGTIYLEEDTKMVKFVPYESEIGHDTYPEQCYFIVPNNNFDIAEIKCDDLLFTHNEPRINNCVTIRTKKTENFTLTLCGTIQNQEKGYNTARNYLSGSEDYKASISKVHRYWNSVINGIYMELDGNDDVQKLNDIIYWYTHNGLIHYLSPHGLEQYNGAAWGVRDVCQGPVELFLATRKLDIIKEILKRVFSHQYLHSGDWPQWFMFDKFFHVQKEGSHGDIIIWPLKALCDYIEFSDDIDFLEEVISYMDIKYMLHSDDKQTVFEHTIKLINKIKDDFIEGTALACYGEGDWDDTLQPADPDMRKNMVSGWTVELIYQTFKRYIEICNRAGKDEMAVELTNLCKSIKNDFNKYIMKDNVVSGFVYFHSLENIDYMLHPDDDKTDIQYRLLPMIRGIISEIFTKEQMEQHLTIIKEHLLFPDGAHLMNMTPEYRGGVKKYFRRAEESAAFSREIGLQYCHAHIRFIEALAKVGYADELYKAVKTILPISIDKQVKNAVKRQSNAYFSSSDAAFHDRYEARKKFHELKEGNVPVKGGWRIYSSGPGIYINQIVSQMLGIRRCLNNIVIDPVLPKELSGLKFNYNIGNIPVQFIYNIENGFSPSNIKINGTEIDISDKEKNKYRDGGVLISLDLWNTLIEKDKSNKIEIFV